MAVNYSDLTPGTGITWKDSGGSFVISLNALGSGILRQGGKSATLVDGTYGYPEILVITLLIQFNGTPTAGNTVDLYLGWSGSSTAATDNDSNLTGADGTMTSADVLKMLGYAGSLVASANIGGSVNQQTTLVVKPRRQYVIPVIDNESGVALKASANVSVVTMTPWYRRTPIS